MFVYFDLDRTLLDFESAADVGIKKIFDLYRSEIKMDFEEFTYGWKKWAQIYFDRYSAGELTFDQQKRARVWKVFELNGINLSKEENDRRFDIYWKAYEKEIRIFDDVIPVLETLKEKGIPMGVITNGDPSNQHWKLDSQKLAGYFTHIIISGDVGISKPDPEIFRMAKEKAGETETGLWFFGDSLEHDIEPSAKLGWHSVFINRRKKKYDVPAAAVEVDDMRKAIPLMIGDIKV